MLRVLVYLNPVRRGGGPFEFIAPSIWREAFARRRYRSGYIDDAAMKARVDPGEWREVTGDIGLSVAFDGAKTFHRAQAPREAPRDSITFTYVSRNPLRLNLATRLDRAKHRALIESLGPRQRACIPRPRLI